MIQILLFGDACVDSYNVCMYVYMCVLFIYICMYSCMDISIYACMCYVHMCVCMLLLTCEIRGSQCCISEDTAFVVCDTIWFITFRNIVMPSISRVNGLKRNCLKVGSNSRTLDSIA